MNIQKCTVCFADLERFYVATRNMPLQELGSFLQTFYECAGSVLITHNGRLVKYVGDAVLAQFERGREEIAVRAMWTLRESFREYVHGLDRADVRACEVNVGIVTGEFITGQIGHPQMLSYDVIGKPIIVAEALLQCGGVVIDGATYEAVKERVVAAPVDQSGDAHGYRVTGFR